jgi:hypothetical protein
MVYMLIGGLLGLAVVLIAYTMGVKAGESRRS